LLESLLSGGDMEDPSAPPVGPPPTALEDEVDVLRAALEETLALVPLGGAEEEDEEEEDTTLQAEAEGDEDGDVWSGFGALNATGKGKEFAADDFQGDENDPGAANRVPPALVAWAPKNKPTVGIPGLGVTWKSPARSKLSIPVSFGGA